MFLSHRSGGNGVRPSGGSGIPQETCSLTPISLCLSAATSFALPEGHVVLCMETLYLEVSEITHERRHLIGVGTGAISPATSASPAVDGSHHPYNYQPQPQQQQQQQGARGSIYIFDVIPVVPEPDRPETRRRLKLLAKEEVKGAVTALCEVGTQGFLLAAQGQKCMVRGLKEDGSLLPVAFMDMMCHVSAARCLPGTGLCVLADAVKGVWFVGYFVSFIFVLVI